MNDRFVEDLKNRVNLVEIVGKYTELKKSGKNFMCRSPFRNERTPSFSVSPDKQVWYDFGASEGGDVIRFVEKIENLSFGEAIEFLADIAGMEIPKNVKLEGPSQQAKKDIYALHEKAVEYFATELKNDPKASAYLKKRGYSAKAIKDWNLGYGGEAKDGLTKFLLKAGFSEAMISQSGVAFERSFGDKSMMDRFWGRVMIPICEPRNSDIIAFSGRDILEREKVGKYVNSPENPVYNKSATLFGLDKARKSIRDKDYVILVEGNFDVVTMHDKGFDMTVATCGTSLTEDHLRILQRLTKNIVLAFDNDVAGKKATLRSVEMCLEMDCNPFILSTDEGKDLDEFLQTKGNEKVLQKNIDEKQNALEFLLERFATKFIPLGIEGQKQFLAHFFYFLQICPRPIEVDHFLGELAKKLNTGKSVLQDEFAKHQKANQKPSAVQKKLQPEENEVKNLSIEESFVGFVLSNWDTFAPTFHPEGEAAEKILDLLNGHTQTLLRKKIYGQKISEAQADTLRGWELYNDNLYGADIDVKILKEDLVTFVQQLTAISMKKQREEQAEEVRKKLGKR